LYLQHVLCGADADLIMLGLASHEPNFTIIREEFKPNKPRPCDLCRQMGHEVHECQVHLHFTPHPPHPHHPHLTHHPSHPSPFHPSSHPPPLQGAAKPLHDGDEYVGEASNQIGEEQKFIFVRLSVLREYLRRELDMPNLPFQVFCMSVFSISVFL
jgi:5'-3' exoribonuclease 2